MSRQIVIDSREQRPYFFDNAIRAALPAGDYSLEGLETTIAIERKSLQDWINTILRSKRRFRAELEKLQSYKFAAVVIESSVAEILSGDYRSDVSPQSLLGLTASIMQSYTPVHIILAGDRPHAAALVAELLKLGGEREWQ
ncbi:MAG: ERCC4 domain-containing protein [Armatimonadota bacterium]